MKSTLLTFAVAIFFAASALAKIIRVPADQPTIQAAINAATKGDTVLVAEGTYFENIDFKGKAITVASHFLMDSDTTHTNNTIINGSRPSDPNKGSVVSFVSGEDTTSVICGFTITGGTGTLYDSNNRVGGGIYCKNSAARIRHNKIVNNSVVYNQSNKSCFGGGIGLWPLQNPHYVIIEDNVIESNSVDAGDISWGGGIFLIKGQIIHNIIRQNISKANSRWGHGGGISATCDNVNNRPLVIIAENTITSNQAFSKDKTDEKTALGGGVDIQYNNIRLINNTITHNLVGLIDGKASQRMQGGGARIWGVKDSALVQDNTISFNSFTGNGICAGGGLHVSNSDLSAKPAKITIKGNRFEGNKGVWGGGLRSAYNPGGIVSDNEFIGNFATDEGGGICDYDSNPFTISNNKFIQNQATRWGGGLSVSDTDGLVVVNNIFIENESRCGGGVLLYQWDPALATSARIINNTITANVADTAGAIGIWRFKKVVSMNNICWGNDAPFAPEILVKGGELHVAYSDIRLGADSIGVTDGGTLNWLRGNIDEDPLFTDPVNGDFNLSEYSPCVGWGTHSIDINGSTYTCPDTDYNGNPRPNPVDEFVDMGAFESEFLKITPDYDVAVQSLRLPCDSIPLFVAIKPSAEILNRGQNNGANFDVTCTVLCDEQPIYNDTTHVPMLFVDQTILVEFKPFVAHQKAGLDFVATVLNFPNDYKSYNNSIRSTAGVTNLIDDFGTETGFWTFEGGWGITKKFGGHSGNSTVHVNNGTTPYQNNMDAKMTFVPGFHFQLGDTATLKYWTIYGTEQDNDVCYVEVTGDSLNWIKMDSVSGTGQKWTQRQVSLLDFIEAGYSKVWIRFHFISDGENTGVGVLIDDVAVYPEPTGTTFVQDLPRAIPTEYGLEQNSPNPFNPATTIRFALPKLTFVTLKIYDLLGREVATLASAKYPAGKHNVKWDASGLASGVYLCRLQAGEFVETKKLILVR